MFTLLARGACFISLAIGNLGCKRYFLFTKIFLVCLFFSHCIGIPKGIKGEKLDKLYKNVLLASNVDSLSKQNYLKFSFTALGKQRDYVWARIENCVQAELDDILVQYNKKDNKKYVAFYKLKDGSLAEIKNSKKEKVIARKAYKNFTNDFFWFNPILHIQDKKKINILYVEPNSLLVTYLNGGVTPGDTYLFHFDDDTSLIKKMQMWVSIIPIKGLEINFENYQIVNQQFRIAKIRKKGILNIEIKNILISNNPDRGLCKLLHKKYAI